MEVHKLSHISCPISVGINGLVERAAPALQQLFLLVLQGEGGGGGGGWVRLVTKLVWISVINCSIHKGCVCV